MAIYEFSNAEKNTVKTEVPLEAEPLEAKTSKRDRFVSSLTARLFFFLLLSGDILWTIYCLVVLVIGLIGMLATGGKRVAFKNVRDNALISLRRSLVCGVSLFIALFSPAFGIMIACTYFLMYDKSGIEEVVPSSLQTQFKEFFPKE